MKITLIGAGSSQFGMGMMSDIFLCEELNGAEICLMDINAETLERTAQKGINFIDANNLPYRITSTTNRKEAVKDADFIIISIEVGDRFELWDIDWTIPHQFGINQVYGENGGPGGLFHALRITPPILEICEDISNISPEAYVFCYSNPMTAITTTVKRKFPNLRFTGMCHEIASLTRYLPSILDTSIENISFRAAGLNHFSVMLEAKYKDSGKNAYPDVMEKAPSFFEKEPGFSELLEYYNKTGKVIQTEGSESRFITGEGIKTRSWSDRHLFKFIMENFNLLPITTDSHIGEYISWAHSVSDHKGILDFYNYYRKMMSLAPEAEFEKKAVIHEKVVYIMAGIISDKKYEEQAVNILNDNFIPGLPENIAVEVPAIISKNGIEGISFPDYPKAFAALLRNYCGVYDLTAEAVIHKDRNFAVQALLVNPVVNDCRRVRDLVDYMIERQSKWLGYLN
ncbi:MAG: alpha-glucosidase [Spirochaetales bacterium]|nr:alpha-glucosidase [Spirochaetales bacterium]